MILLNIVVSKPTIGLVEAWAAARVVLSGNLAQGAKVEEFENRFAREVLDGQTEAVAVNSGTSGLVIALLASGVGPGDEVIVPAFTFAATANAVALCGATPVFCDIESDSFNMDPAFAESLITRRTRALVPVHLYGNPANMVRIREIATANSLLVIEDAAQAHGASIDGKPVGTFGDAGVFSFYPTKNMTTGEGGLVSTKNPAIARTARLLRNQGMERRYENEIPGFNNRMTDISGAIGLVQLSKLPKFTERRKKIAAIYSSELRNVTTPLERFGFRHVYHQYTIDCTKIGRERVIDALDQKGIPYGIYYPKPVHLLPSFKSSLTLKNTEAAAKAVLSLPMHPGLSEKQISLIVRTINAI